MKSVTEFASYTLTQALQKQAAWVAEGKTPEEIETSLGEAYKYEGDKLKHFVQALNVAGQNTEGLKRVVVLQLNEGESAPVKSIQVESSYYVPEFYVKASAAPAPTKGGFKGGRGGGRGGGDKKGSPWGLSPEEKAAKKGAGKTAKA